MQSHQRVMGCGIDGATWNVVTVVVGRVGSRPHPGRCVLPVVILIQVRGFTVGVEVFVVLCWLVRFGRRELVVRVRFLVVVTFEVGPGFELLSDMLGLKWPAGTADP